MNQLWWKELQNPMASVFSQNSSSNFNKNEQDDNLSVSKGKEDCRNVEREREAMFEKPLTPSDVGKLNRLVIPKQHAERYFPIGGNEGSGEAAEKVMLLSFEDELGKSWRFRYSYWNSSQSYVLTKGWSRFVKEKRLDAGDTIVFERFKNEGNRFFIGWRRRNTGVKTDGVVVAEPAVSGGGRWTPAVYSGYPYPSHTRPNGPPLPYQPHCLHAGGSEGTSAGVKNETSSGNSKTVRLFGVNLECQIVDEPPMSGGSTQDDEPHPHFLDRQNHMFARDVNQLRHHQG